MTVQLKVSAMGVVGLVALMMAAKVLLAMTAQLKVSVIEVSVLGVVALMMATKVPMRLVLVQANVVAPEVETVPVQPLEEAILSFVLRQTRLG
jgi:hypothetical protein